MKTLKATLATMMGAALLSSPAMAGPPMMPAPEISLQPESPWAFEYTPYGWLAGIEGTATVAGISTNLDLSTNDILSNLDMVASGTLGVRYNRFGLFTDHVYVRISPSYETPGPLFRDTRLVMKTTMVDLKGSYRLYDTERAWLDLLAGARYYKQDLSITLNAGLLPTRSGSGSEGWWDAVGGVRGQYHFADKWFLYYLADVGAGSSDLTWQAYGGLGYQFNDWFSATVGYRYLDYDYTSGDLGFDAATKGFVIGLGFEW